MSKIFYTVLAFITTISLGVCSGMTSTPVSIRVSNDKVSLQQSTINWNTYKYELSQDNTIVEGSFDGVTITQQTFKSWVLENKYLKVTIVPGFGGRIISIIYKPTGHEELYRNPVGVPYSVEEDVFYYDWLMIYGGIFPTFPEPEHGKTWLLPWDFQIVKNTDQEVTVSVSIKDNIDNPSAPDQYNVGVTGIEATFYVTVKAGRAAVETSIVLKNPGTNSVAYEYWTNTGLSPGSDPLDPTTTDGAEIIAPVEKVKIPGWCTAISSRETPAEEQETYYFKSLRHYKNWPDPGIAYAFPDMTGGNFWGVINHDNEEGFFRIADNKITPGLKIWTFGYPYSSVVDSCKTTDPRRPFVELWAGLTKEFWSRAIFPANHQFAIKETYSPSVGLTNVTHANENFLVNLYIDNSSVVNCQLFSINPDESVNVSLFLDGTTMYNSTITPNPQNRSQISVKIPANSSKGSIKLVIKDMDGTEMFTGTIPVNN